MEQLYNRLLIRSLSSALALMLWLPWNVSAQNTDTTKVEDPEAARYEELLNSEMDQMLNTWYVKREAANAHSTLSHLSDDNEIDENTNLDSIYQLRLSRLNSGIQLGYSSAVKTYIELYANKRKRSSSAILGLAQYYFPMMKEIFDKYNIPEELVYLTIVESSLNPTAVSPAGATGIWQFMYTTGKTYGLHVNSFIDDRRDPVKATEAAARHLRDLYKIFNDWGLAISAYNSGAGNVRKAVARSGGKSTFWEIRPFLPRETQNYFPAFIGVYYMMNYYKTHGITPAKISIPTDIDTVMVQKEVHFEQIAHVLNIDVKEIETLNPQYKRDVIPAFEKSYPLKLRNRDILRFIQLQDSIYKYNYDTYFAPLQMYVSSFTGKPSSAQSVKKYHTVKSGENLSKIANKYGLSVEEIKKMNKLKSNYVKTGQKLIVGYTKPKTSTSTSSSTSGTKPSDNKTDDNSKAGSDDKTQTDAAQQANGNAEYTIHTVKSGENLLGIANKYHTTIAKIVSCNHLKNANVIVVGQKLKIPKN